MMPLSRLCFLRVAFDLGSPNTLLIVNLQLREQRPNRIKQLDDPDVHLCTSELCLHETLHESVVAELQYDGSQSSLIDRQRR